MTTFTILSLTVVYCVAGVLILHTAAQDWGSH